MPASRPAAAARRALLTFLVLASPVGAQTPVLTSESWQRPPAAVESAILAPRHLNVTLTNLSPDRQYFVRLQPEGMPTQAEFARPHYYYGGLQVDVNANRVRQFTTRGASGLAVINAHTGRATTIEVPRGTNVSEPRWSPDGKRLAYYVNYPNATHIYVADAATGRARQVTNSPVLATINTTIEWTADGRSIATVLVPQDRGPAPAAPAVPTSPKVRLTTAGENKTRTYPSLLEWPYEMQQLEYYTTGQLALIDVDSRAVRRIGRPAMIRSVDMGPQGQYLRVSTLQKPFSYIVPVSQFAAREEIWSTDGRVLAKLADRALNDGVEPDSATRAAREKEMRSFSWRSEGLAFLQLAPAPAGRPQADSAAPAEGGAARGARQKDRVMLWQPPFDSASLQLVYESDARLSGVDWSPDGSILFLREGSSGGPGGGDDTPAFGRGGAAGAVSAVYLADPTKKYPITRRLTGDDAFYKNPGTLLTTSTPQGGSAVQLSAEGAHVFLSGTQYFEKPEQDAPRAFIDRVEIMTGKKERVYEGENAGVSERVVAVLDDDASRLVVSRETPTTVPDSYLRTADGKLTKLTSNRDYNPDITNAPHRRYWVTRPDGRTFKVDVTLPQDWKPGTRLPAMFWFYPSEFTDQKAYDQTNRTFNRNAFRNLNVRSMDFLIKEGYAVVAPDAPIFGESGRMNDNYENDLRNNLAATIDALDREGIIDRQRLGLGGHSYGAFSTVNAMVHTPFFKAGIAGDGNYNRTLTPMTFQTERRELWEARETYLSMSPFLYANNLTGALLMYHGLADQNVGTDPINSIRLFQALNGLNKTAALYMYPYEDHGPATRETILDLWARWVSWLDTYVKNPKPAQKERVTTQQ